MTTINTKEKPTESKTEQQSGHLPYTFVVVATVCTCMFLIVLVVFSIVRHTTLSKRQRSSSIERAPMRIRIRSHNPRYRTRHHRHHRSSRSHVVMHGAVRQTVSGFFEGNVAPPPYSAVLDDNESVRAGDPPPPYRPPSCVAIGVIVWKSCTTLHDLCEDWICSVFIETSFWCSSGQNIHGFVTCACRSQISSLLVDMRSSSMVQVTN